MTSLSDSGRFEFGANWRAFLSVVNVERIEEAQRSLAGMLGYADLTGQTFLDIGCGSGLFSLAARRMGARVRSFDFDRLSVNCAEELKRLYASGDPDWSIEVGSVLDRPYMDSLGQFDIVYSWGVLHHTGQMWTAIENACRAAAADGQLFVAIYNDQGPWSVFWTRVKQTYNRLPRALRAPYVLAFATALEIGALGTALLRLDPRRFVNRWTRYQSVRGMSRWYDIVDWIGGYPFEVAKPEQILEHCRARGFELTRLRTCGGRMGCNEFLFQSRPPEPRNASASQREHPP
jgi:2-polyprenyl-6-hydroxyphenyl methylase/3-demethylubiquinone-9 3-methyltransferase